MSPVSHLDIFRAELQKCSTVNEVHAVTQRLAPGIGVTTRRRKSVRNAVQRKLDEIHPPKPRFEPYE